MRAAARIGEMLRHGVRRFSRPVRLAPQQAYALWADVYPPRPHNALMLAEQSVIAPMIAASGPTRALDVGTGTGRLVPLLRDAGAAFVAGADLSAAMLSRHRSDARKIRADACRLPFADGRFDVVCSSLMVGDVEDLSAWVREASRVLERGGHLIYSDFHPVWTVHRWKRTFRTKTGRLVELSFHPHAIEQHLACLETASFRVRAIREPAIAPGSPPVVVVFHAVKQ
jgi:ubiquinone/menaquinone biosynthesis C-methylase UbiE